MEKTKITYKDVEEYETLFSLAPSFLLKKFVRRKTNLVSKFRPQIQSYLDNLNCEQKAKLDIILKSDIDELQEIMQESYIKSHKKQYKILADPSSKDFIRFNLDELRKMLESD